MKTSVQKKKKERKISHPKINKKSMNSVKNLVKAKSREQNRSHAPSALMPNVAFPEILTTIIPQFLSQLEIKVNSHQKNTSGIVYIEKKNLNKK